jgi:tetratricopeptide (TPR) repeat protein
MNKAQQFLFEGQAAMKRKDFNDAEPLFMAAFKAYPAGDGGRLTACINLGIIYRNTGRDQDAIAALEKGLPYPAAFKELIGIYRARGKAARKVGDAATESECFRRMLSLAKVHEGVRAIADWHTAAKWIEDIRKQCGTVYPYTIAEVGEIPGDPLLSNADYKAIRAQSVGRSN